MQRKSKIAPHQLKAAEAFRLTKHKRIRLNVIHFFAIIVVAIIAIVLLQHTESNLLPPFIFLFLAGNFFYTLYMYFNIHKTYQEGFRDKVLKRTLPLNLPGLNFISDVKIEDVNHIWKKNQPFRNVEIGYLSKVGSHIKSIGIRGVYQDLDFEIYDVNIYRAREYKRRGRSRNNTSDFSGLMMRAKRNSKIDTPVYLISKYYSLNNPLANKIDGFIYENHKVMSPPPKIQLGFDSFENEVSVYSDSVNTAKQLLNSEVVNAILNIKKELINRYSQIIISIVDDEVFVMVEYNLGLIPTDLTKSLMEEEALNKIFKSITSKINFLRILSK